MSFTTKFSNLGHADRVWTIASVNGRIGQLVQIHAAIYNNFRAGDRVVYTGNYLGGIEQAEPVKTLDELLYFRRTLLALPGIVPEDIVHLRGMQEELWNRILQLQFAPNAPQIVEWIQKTHPEMNSILHAYGSSLEELGRVAREGVLSLTRWIVFVKGKIRSCNGHEIFLASLRRAAFTENGQGDNDNNILFVHAGINPAASLENQGDSFWWNGKDFIAQDAACRPFKSVVRGFDPESNGIRIGRATISLDGGAQIICARISGTGDVQDVLAA